MDNKMKRFLEEQARIQRLISQAAISPGSKITSQMDVISQMSRIASSIDSDYFKFVSKWSSDVSRLAKTGSINLNDLVPIDFYKPMEELIRLALPTAKRSGNSDLLAEITVQERAAVTHRKLSWLDYFQLVFTILMAIYSIYSGYDTSLQLQEILSEIQMQNESIEKNTIIQEQILQEIQSQHLTEEEKLEAYQVIDEKVDELIESIDTFIESRDNIDTHSDN
ncbi:hypothetical protein SporoP37_01990 [Sporosarcina sp. P37]|uniref:hypothetical protein n=1 Tax=unclassified Sporosarcina TaxID=2647733 RepID=UPI000A17DA5C|nr:MULTISPECIES: hypothetical protein [unclassified Sporosarcina]ARK23583.1 hypothetical protein SporoP37_01990 [Sporosarcina sp. P37]PID18794.1 hypothetical protein CSV62_06760 [Sporosarcina sp. P35]